MQIYVILRCLVARNFLKINFKIFFIIIKRALKHAKNYKKN